MAYRLFYDGRHKDKYRADKGSVLVLAKKIGDDVIYVTRDEVLHYVNDQQFLYYLNVYQYVKLWGMPNGAGWANEPCDILEAITALEIEHREIEADAMKKPAPKKES